MLLSAAAAWGVATNYGMRCGGFVGAAFIGMFMGDPWQVLVAASIAAATYLIVTRLLMNHMILFGRRKFSSMLLVASSLSWLLLWSGREFFGPEVQRHLDLGSLALAPLFLPGLIANDAQRTSPRKVVLGFAMASTFVLTWTWWAQSLFEGLALALAWKVIAVGALAAIFWRQVVPVRRLDAEATEHVGVPAHTAQPAATGVAAAFGMGGYRRWAAAHPAAALAAERWLTAMVGDGSRDDAGARPGCDRHRVVTRSRARCPADPAVANIRPRRPLVRARTHARQSRTHSVWTTSSPDDPSTDSRTGPGSTSLNVNRPSASVCVSATESPEDSWTVTSDGGISWPTMRRCRSRSPSPRSRRRVPGTSPGGTRSRCARP